MSDAMAEYDLMRDALDTVEDETPTLDDIEAEDSQAIGETIRDLSVGNVVKVTNNSLDFYIKGVVVEVNDYGDGYHDAIIRFGRKRAELHANWRDIPPESDDQETPYTGLLFEPFDDTAPAVTGIEVWEGSGERQR